MLPQIVTSVVGSNVLVRFVAGYDMYLNHTFPAFP